VDLSENKLIQPPTVNLLLTRLALSENQITSLNSLFGGDDSMSHSQLVELHIRDNRLMELDSDIVQRLLHIKLLDLRNNNLSSLPSVLGYLPNVRQILIDGNRLRTLGSVDRGDPKAIQALLRKRGPAPPGNGYLPQETDSSFAKSTTQQSASPSRNTAAANVDILSSALVGTKILNLEGRQLTMIPEAWLHQLRGSNMAQRIEVLKLGKNKLEQIDGDLLTNLPNISTMEVDQNCLSQLPSELRALSLSVLSLSRNRLTAGAISSAVLCNSLGVPMRKTLTQLDLSSNRLENLSSGLLEFKALRVLNLSNNRITSLAIDLSTHSGWKTGLPALEHLDLSDNRIENLGDLPLALGASCPMIKTLLLQNNELKMIPPQLGMLDSLQTIDLRGNPQRAVRSAILEKGCDTILLYLHNRLTPAELEDYEVKRRAMSESLPVADLSSLADDESRAESQTDSQTSQGAKANAKTETSPLADELRAEVDSLSLRLNSVHLSEAQKYATKKKLAVQKAKLIREERRLRQEKGIPR